MLHNHSGEHGPASTSSSRRLYPPFVAALIVVLDRRPHLSQWLLYTAADPNRVVLIGDCPSVLHGRGEGPRSKEAVGSKTRTADLDEDVAAISTRPPKPVLVLHADDWNVRREESDGAGLAVVPVKTTAWERSAGGSES